MDEQRRVLLCQSTQPSCRRKLLSSPVLHRVRCQGAPSKRYQRRDQRMLQHRGDESCRLLPLQQNSQTCSPVIFNVDLPSAGVPNRTTLPPRLCFLITSAAASAAPTDATAIKLCPQACPSPVKASNRDQPSCPPVLYHHPSPPRPAN
jgi:hypothetical protein